MSGHLAASALIKRTGPCDKTVIGPGLDKPAVGPASAENGLETTRTGNLRKDDDRAQIFKPPPLMARSAIRSRECRVRGN